MKLALGQYDDPLNQRQPILYLDPYQSNIAIFGAPMSGKTTFIKTLLVRLHENMGNQAPVENIYLIDFGGNIGSFGKLGNICACFDSSNEENIKRVFKTIERRLADNAKQLDSQSYYSVATKTPQKAPTHIFLIIENINAFLADERYATYQDTLIRFCRDGLSKGLTVVITANETAGLNRLLSNFRQKIAFEMPNESYHDIFDTKVNKPMRIPGRGIVNIDAAIYEFQCFLPFSTKSDKEDEQCLERLIEETNKHPNENAIAAFSDDLTWENYDRYCSKDSCRLSDTQIVVGLDYYEHKPVAVNIDESRAIAIYGKRRYGKTNLLHLLLEGIHAKVPDPDANFIYFDDGRKQLLDFYNADSKKAEYFTDVTRLQEYLAEEGYISIRRGQNSQPSPIKETPYTVFVMQSKMLYRNSPAAKSLLGIHFPLMISDAIARKFLFIFSDVPNISEQDIRRIFNDNISVAFLLDNIGDFLSDRNDKTAFGSMDARELKAEYARCSVGDGYAYDVDTAELQKLKFIKVE